MPSERLRKLEVDANSAFDQYREMYFEGGVSSVYLWDLDNGFAGVILIKKAGDPGSKKIKVRERGDNRCHVAQNSLIFEHQIIYFAMSM